MICTAGEPAGSAGIPELPTWREMTVSVSAQAAMIGSQCGSHSDGSPISWGLSGRVTEVKPRFLELAQAR